MQTAATLPSQYNKHAFQVIKQFEIVVKSSRNEFFFVKIPVALLTHRESVGVELVTGNWYNSALCWMLRLMRLCWCRCVGVATTFRMYGSFNAGQIIAVCDAWSALRHACLFCHRCNLFFGQLGPVLSGRYRIQNADSSLCWENGAVNTTIFSFFLYNF